MCPEKLQSRCRDADLLHLFHSVACILSLTPLRRANAMPVLSPVQSHIGEWHTQSRCKPFNPSRPQIWLPYRLFTDKVHALVQPACLFLGNDKLVQRTTVNLLQPAGNAMVIWLHPSYKPMLPASESLWAFRMVLHQMPQRTKHTNLPLSLSCMNQMLRSTAKFASHSTLSSPVQLPACFPQAGQQKASSAQPRRT